MTLHRHPAWGLPRPGRGLLAFAVVLLGLLFVWMGWLLSGHSVDPGVLLQAPLRFAHWQLTAVLQWGAVKSPDFSAPGWALLWDLPFILAYAYVLAWFNTSGLARVAGLRRAGQAAPQWLSLLGWALPLTVFADVLENLLTAATLLMAGSDHLRWAWIFSVFMAAASLAKFIGLLGAIVLSLCALRPRR